MVTVTWSREQTGDGETGRLRGRYSVMLVSRGKPGSDHEASLFETHDRDEATRQFDLIAARLPTAKVDRRLFDYNLATPTDD